RRHQPCEFFVRETGRAAFELFLDCPFGQRIARPFLGHDIQQQHGDARIGKHRRNTRTHDAGTEDGSLFDYRHGYAFSNTVAMPCPPPIQAVASAYFPCPRESSSAALPVMRAPDAPSGWPSAIAPPSTF